mmetsp:Transcript_51521/g.167178  ORF Transcript_51521/g.167178 Transcript_51521/m.167178 type:complete len:109 (+) Transcript_51521:991-1317(+)
MQARLMFTQLFLLLRMLGDRQAHPGDQTAAALIRGRALQSECQAIALLVPLCLGWGSEFGRKMTEPVLPTVSMGRLLPMGAALLRTALKESMGTCLAEKADPSRVALW